MIYKFFHFSCTYRKGVIYLQIHNNNQPGLQPHKTYYMKTIEDYIVLQKMYEEGGEGKYYITSRGNFEEQRLCECRGRYGQHVTCYYAGCYTFDNSCSDAEKDCITALCEKFGVVKVEEGIEDIVEGDSSAFASIELNEIRTFVEKWKEENEQHEMALAWTYWDGSNYKTFVLKSEDDSACDVKELPDKQQKKILAEMPDTPYIEKATESVETANYIFSYSRYANDPWICRVEEK